MELTEYTCEWHSKQWVELAGLVLVLIVYPGIEYWFGVTRKTAAGSLVEQIIIWVFRRKRREPNQKLLTGHVQPEKEDSMFEGPEFEKELGEGGKYGKIVADIHEDLSFEIGYKGNLRTALQNVASTTSKAWLRGGINFALGFFEPKEQNMAESKSEKTQAEKSREVNGTQASDQDLKENAQKFAVAQTDIKEANQTEPKQGPTPA